jgi:hypothetical protein
LDEEIVGEKVAGQTSGRSSDHENGSCFLLSDFTGGTGGGSIEEDEPVPLLGVDESIN